MNLNKILTDQDREDYAPRVKQMFQELPEMMLRKIPRANVQQAFAIETVIDEIKSKNTTLDMLCVGAHEDTALAYLEKKEYDIEKIDPVLNIDLTTFAQGTNKKFDIIFSVSVIEHVQDDEQFVEEICSLLKKDGLAVLTCDFKDNYIAGDPLIDTCCRFYTKYDLCVRLQDILLKNNCALTNNPTLDAPPDFIMGNFIYNFATFVFRKN